MRENEEYGCMKYMRNKVEWEIRRINKIGWDNIRNKNGWENMRNKVGWENMRNKVG